MTQTLTAEEKKFNEWMMGNRDAIGFLKILANISQFADDLADGDVAATPASMGTLLHQTMVVLPSCDFFMKHAKWFVPLFNTSIALWAQTDKWAAGDDEELKIFGYVYRSILEQVIVQAATLVAGWDHACYVARDMNEFYRATSDSYEEWKQEHKLCV